MEELVLLLMIFFSFRYHVTDKNLVICRDWFGAIVKLLSHIELLMYTKILSLSIQPASVPPKRTHNRVVEFQPRIIGKGSIRIRL